MFYICILVLTKFSLTFICGSLSISRIEFGRLALENKPVNLGQGFPDMPPPESVAKPLREAVIKGGDFMIHQYARGFVSKIRWK